MNEESKAPVYAVGAEFDSAASLMEAAKKVRDRGYQHWDVYSPFPIHGMDAAMGLSNSRVSAVSLAGGITGALTAFVLVYLTGGVDYPLVVHGKPYFAIEPTFPIYFELTILFTAFGTVGGMFLFNLLPRWNHPVFNWERILKATDDGFFLVIETRDPRYHLEETQQLLKDIGGNHIELIRDET